MAREFQGLQRIQSMQACGNVFIPGSSEVVTESSGRGFREGLINLTTANPATLNFLVTIFMAAHCGTRGGGGGFAQRRPWAAFSRPRGKISLSASSSALFPSFSQCGLFNSCKRVCALLQLGHVFRLVRLTRCTHLETFFILFLLFRLSQW